ncbi:malate:quinone oxidoreductase [Marinobacter panjinensis]|uniref:Probable malate:quinone oxidoreductase n=1 Tax=Marinobacter panjinensis TaxID=2576384 RepID=A0A4U6R3R2_9GAMM|nr:malate:quinone oxidoreductase [Marinobacter panjinensis]MCR8915698.1 malate:quinone oxidoreductase [Marinobacter panjinensis]TKV66936.1 malate:quinone oxidoreductase [Marinobacter panjinensis]
MNVVIIGAGIMGTTFATLAKELAPDLDITILERLDGPGAGNSSAFWNAGTGHEANCELNYTPVDEEVISVEKALKIHAQFNVAKQFWAHLIEKGAIKDPKTFINQTKHCTIVSESAIEELKLRFKEMSAHHFFEHMRYSEDFDEIKSWIPYTMEERPRHEKMAATVIETGTDVNFGALTAQMAAHAVNDLGVRIEYGTHVKRVHKSPTGRWVIEAVNKGGPIQHRADVLFVGAGGGAFPLLKRSHLPFRSRFTGFPVGGRFLRASISEEQAKHYRAKTYGKAKVGAPPMSVPHLDLRVVDGKHYLLFGPFASFKPVLERGRGFFDYLTSIRLHDVPGLLNVALEHFPLVKYLISESFKGEKSMFEELDSFAPGLSKKFDWKPIEAGQRVQIIKDGDLQMGTEILVSTDKTYGTLLGASPGASVSPEVMLRCLEQLIPSVFSKEEARQKRNEIFPEDDLDTLINQPDRYREIRDAVNKQLGIARP